MARTRRVDCTSPGIERIRHGRGFSYREADGTRIEEPELLQRIAELAIPPAWTEVWICPDPRGHIQATGYDDAGRKQYLYHPDWRRHRDREKFDRMLEFARRLPTMREQTDADLGRRGLQRRRVLACAASLLDLGFFRIGGERYAAENESYGLATLKKRHLRFENGVAVFDFPAKGSKRQRQEIADPSVLPTIRALKRRRRGDELFGYRSGGSWVDMTSEELNEYLKELTGSRYTAKDFRTWNATVLAAIAVASQSGEAMTKTARRRIVKQATGQVAEYLGNTPAVCRSAYIDPRVFDRFDAGETIRSTLDWLAARNGRGFADRQTIERAVRRLLG